METQLQLKSIALQGKQEERRKQMHVLSFEEILFQ
jgi:hypothetical protein